MFGGWVTAFVDITGKVVLVTGGSDAVGASFLH